MAEQSVEEIRRLARNFLVGKGGPGDLADLKRDMESDHQLPFELLHLMQTALDEVPPAGFSPDQWKEMDARVASMVNPLLRTGFGKIGNIFSGLFKKRSKEVAPSARLRRRGIEEPEFAARPAPAPALDSLASVAFPPAGGIVGVEGSMEELAPIATAPVLAPEAPAPIPIPVPVPVPISVRAPATLKVSVSKASRKIWLLVALALAAVLVYAGVELWLTGKSHTVKYAPVVQPAVTPSAQPTAQSVISSGLPVRSRGVIELGETLPSELPPQTPQAGENFTKPGDLEAKDKAGNHGFPLP